MTFVSALRSRMTSAHLQHESVWRRASLRIGSAHAADRLPIEAGAACAHALRKEINPGLIF